ncbi:unnamed protein product, partial [Allacma fusca]
SEDVTYNCFKEMINNLMLNLIGNYNLRKCDFEEIISDPPKVKLSSIIANHYMWVKNVK